VDVEAAYSVKNGISFPLEISCVPFTFSNKHKDFTPLLRCVEKKNARTTCMSKTTKGESELLHSLHGTKKTRKERNTVTTAATTSIFPSVVLQDASTVWKKGICLPFKKNGNKGMLKGEYHCLISSGYPELAFYKQACFCFFDER